MFKINPAPTFTVPVPLSVPGLPEPLEVNINFKHKSRAALAKYLAELGGREHTAYLHEVIDSWTGVHNDAGEPVPYSITALSDLLGNYSVAHAEILAAYTRELTEAKRKNS
jgi:hypothetical protein